ncbi:hypothetical protein IE984_21690 [Klebsiella pneumoniae]|nr:hypothetical protein [Klebsiella pneumoniae]
MRPLREVTTPPFGAALVDDKPDFVRVSAFLPGGGFRLTRPTKDSNINKLCSSL